jgi:hypothetical protein
VRAVNKRESLVPEPPANPSRSRSEQTLIGLSHDGVANAVALIRERRHPLGGGAIVCDRGDERIVGGLLLAIGRVTGSSAAVVQGPPTEGAAEATGTNSTVSCRCAAALNVLQRNTDGPWQDADSERAGRAHFWLTLLQWLTAR